MPRSTTEIAHRSAVTALKDGHAPRPIMARAKPFMVTSLATKWRAPTTKKTPVQKLSRASPTSSEERMSVPRRVAANQMSRPHSLPTVLPKAEPRRPPSKPVPVPVRVLPPMSSKERSSFPTSRAFRPGMEPRRLAQRPVSLPVPSKTSKAYTSLPSGGQSLSKKTVVPKPLKIVEKFKESKPMGRRTAPARPTRVTTANNLPPRPGCVPRSYINKSSVVSKGKKDVMIKTFTADLHLPEIPRQKPCTNIGTDKITRRVKVTGASTKKSVVDGGCHTGMPTQNRRMTPPRSVTCPYAVELTWSPPPSPDLSSFPSQSWTIVVGADIKGIKTPVNICGDETSSSEGDAPKSGVVGTPKDSCRQSEAVSSCPTLSTCSTVIKPLENPARRVVRADGRAKVATLTKVPSTEVSHKISAATIIPPSRNGPTSMASLAKVMDCSRTPSDNKAKLSDSGNRIRMSIQRAFKIARAFVSPSLYTSQSATKAATSKPGSNVSRIRKLFVPPLDKNVKTSRDPMTQMQIEALRARRKVAGNGAVDPLLARLGSAMAMVTKLGVSGSGSAGQV